LIMMKYYDDAPDQEINKARKAYNSIWLVE